MLPLIVETTSAGIDPLVLVLVSAMTAGIGFAARYWIKERDNERTQTRADTAEDRKRMQAELDAERAKNAELQKALDGYRDRTPELIALLDQLIRHTENPSGAPSLPQRSTKVRIRPRQGVRR